MTFYEAIPFLLEKHCIRRKSWKDEDGITLFGGVWWNNGFIAIFEEDIVADNWEAIPLSVRFK